MGALHERKSLENKMSEVMQAQKMSGHAMVPWTTYVDLQQVFNSWARKKAHDDAQRAENARKPRPNRGFPAWMRKTAIEYAATTQTPLPATAVDLIQLEAEKNEYTKNRWPDERTIRRWWKEGGASGR